MGLGQRHKTARDPSGEESTALQLPELLEAAIADVNKLTPEQAKDAEDKAAALADYLRDQQGHEEEAKRHAQLALIAARKVAIELTKERQIGRPRKGASKKLQASLQFSRGERNAYYAIAEVTEDAFRVFLREEPWPTRTALEKLGKKLRRAKKLTACAPTPPPPLVVQAQRRLRAYLEWASTAAKTADNDTKILLMASAESVGEGAEILTRSADTAHWGFISGGIARAQALFEFDENSA